MKRRRQILIVVAVGLVAALSGIGTHLWRLAPDASAADTLWGLRLPDLAGQQQDMAQWRGKVVIVNFWATWCAPCREEVPLFVAAKQQYADKPLEIVGIGIDHAAKLRDFAANYRVNYPILVAGSEAIEIMRELGNKAAALPYTVLLDRSGGVVGQRLGAFRKEELAGVLAALVG